MTVCLILGGLGQDGYFLSSALSKQGIKTYISGRQPFERGFVARYPKRISYEQIDILDTEQLGRALQKIRPDVVFNFAGSSHVGESWNGVDLSRSVNLVGVQRVVEAVRDYRDARGDQIFLYHSSSSEIFGNQPDGPQSEATPFSRPARTESTKRALTSTSATSDLSTRYQLESGSFITTNRLFVPPALSVAASRQAWPQFRKGYSTS